MGKRRLDVIEIAEPCSEDWGAMRGDERVRFCGLCHRNVYHLGTLTTDEIEALVRENEDGLCVRFVRRADGTVTTADCTPERLAALRRQARRSLKLAAATFVGLLATVGAVGLAGDWLISFAEPDPEPCELEVMGAMPMEPMIETPEEDPPVTHADPADEQIESHTDA